MDLIKQIENNFFSVSRYWGSLNSSLIQIDSICAMNTGVKISDINWAWNEKPLNNNDATSVSAIKEYYSKLNLRYWWWVYPCGQSYETQKILQDSGFRLIEKVTCMATELNNSFLDMELTKNIRISEVKDKNDLSAWETVSFNGFEMPFRAREQYGSFVSSFKLGHQSPQKLFLAYLDEIPVATSILFTDKNSAGIYYVSTLSAHRNKGCGLRVTQAAMQSAKESGFTNITLQATPMGARIYMRAGFHQYCHAEIYKL